MERSSRKTWYRKCIETGLSAEQRHWATVAEGQLDKNMCKGVDVQNVEARGAGAKKASSLGRCEGVGPWTVCIVL